MAKAQNKPVKSNQERWDDFLYYASLPFRLITWPFYLIWYWLYRVPVVPNFVLGAVRLAIFIAIALQYREIDMFIIRTVDHYELPKFCASIPMGLYSILMLIGIFFSFLQMLGMHDGTKSGLMFSMADSPSSGSGFDAIDESLQYRETLLKATHLPGKVEELKKTRFVTAEEISSSSPETKEALGYMNTIMRAQHLPGKYETLKEMFGGK